MMFGPLIVVLFGLWAAFGAATQIVGIITLCRDFAGQYLAVRRMLVAWLIGALVIFAAAAIPPVTAML